MTIRTEGTGDKPGTTPAGASGPVTTGDQGVVGAYPSPWRLVPHLRTKRATITDRDGGHVVSGMNLQKAEIIVAAVNDKADLLAALKAAIGVAEEARKEWDAAPNGMRAGKLLIALAGGCRGYRGDIDDIHAALTKAEGR